MTLQTMLFLDQRSDGSIWILRTIHNFANSYLISQEVLGVPCLKMLVFTIAESSLFYALTSIRITGYRKSEFGIGNYGSLYCYQSFSFLLH